MKTIGKSVLLAMVICLIAVNGLFAATYLPYGDNWFDANKSSFNTEDDVMCWAASAANILKWGGWGTSSLNTEDLIWQNFQNHWTDKGGSQYYGWYAWFDGVNKQQGDTRWSQIDVAGFGNHYPTLDASDYVSYSNDNFMAMYTIEDWLQQDLGIGLGLSGGMDHAITLWGFECDDTDVDYYTGIYITDSDDTDDVNWNERSLKYYDIILSDEGKWFLQDYYDLNTAYIDDIIGLAKNPNAVPLPASVLLFGTGLVGLLSSHARRKKRISIG